jgi:hypothetical protein
MQCGSHDVQGDVCYSTSEAGDVLQTASLSSHFYLGVTDRLLTASEVGRDIFVGQPELHTKHLSPVLQNLGAVAKLRKLTVSFVMSVRPSVRPQGTVRLPLDGLL